MSAPRYKPLTKEQARRVIKERLIALLGRELYYGTDDANSIARMLSKDSIDGASEILARAYESTHKGSGVKYSHVVNKPYHNKEK